MFVHELLTVHEKDPFQKVLVLMQWQRHYLVVFQVDPLTSFSHTICRKKKKIHRPRDGNKHMAKQHRVHAIDNKRQIRGFHSHSKGARESPFGQSMKIHE